SLAPDHAFAHAALGYAQMMTNRGIQGIAECERALALDRNLGHAHAGIGLAKWLIGRAEETEPHIQQALRLSPRDTFAHPSMVIAGLGKLLYGSDDEAVVRFRRAIELNRNYPIAHLFLGAALALLDRLDEARTAVQAGLALAPASTMRRFRTSGFSDNPIYLSQCKRLNAGLRKAGMPE